MKKIIRVFPRKTKGTPDDDLSFGRIDKPVGEADEIHVSVAFTYDLPLVDEIISTWRGRGEIMVGGPAYMDEEGDFVSGKYLKDGYTITSRGCPNRCWHCRVWRKNPALIELPIIAGHIVQDDNILACSHEHIENVFKMLKIQKDIVFSGGLDPELLKDWHLEKMNELKIKQLFTAYDNPRDLEPVANAAKLLNEHGYGIKNRKAFCYVLIGYPKDTIDVAEHRLKSVFKMGLIPFAMLYKDKNGETKKEWRKFQRLWANMFILMSTAKKMGLT